MNVLVIGSGGREHTLTWKIHQSPACDRLFVLPGNAGTADMAENIDLPLSDFNQIGDFVVSEDIGLVVVGPEAPLVDGIRDYFESRDDLKNILFIGPGREGAMLEGSKDFAKQFMEKHGIPTAAYRTFDKEHAEEARSYIRQLNPPIVLKADGLAAGKGVIICETNDQAVQVIDEMLLEEKFGKASRKVVIEEFLEGIEVSVFLLTDGRDYVVFPEAKDYKRIGENDSGPNTGGMGSVSPVSFADKTFMEKVEARIIRPTIQGLEEDRIPFRGFIFLGLMNKQGDPYVIEYNVRMGDPESQVVIPRIKNDFMDLLKAAASGKLASQEIETDPDHAVTVVLAAGGYPGHYEKGKEIHGLNQVKNAFIFHAGTRLADQTTLTNGGRVLAVTGMGPDLRRAIEKTYSEVSEISWQDFQYRRDIGQDLLKLEN